MKSEFSLTNQLLIAMPSLKDINFNQSVTLICDHNETGAMGIIINHPLELKLSELLAQFEIVPGKKFIERQVFSGGPVQTHMGLVMHTIQESSKQLEPSHEEWESSFKINENVALTSSKDILQALSEGKGPEDASLILGYAGWGPGQLEQELMDNSWITAPATNELIFDVPTDQLWRKAAQSIGVDLSKMSIQIGHA